MGCDIHMYRERRVNGVWETDTLKEANDPADPTYYDFESGMRSGGRDYYLFAILSGVRSYGPMSIAPPAEDRGFPDDVTDINNDCKEQWDSDGHSHGYLDMAELSALIEKYHQAPVLHEPTARDDFGYAHQVLCQLKENAHARGYFAGLEPEDCRILFFYDN